MKKLIALLCTFAFLTSCVPTSNTEEVALTGITCQQTPPPVVAIIDFENTTGRFGITVTGVEAAANARLITLLKQTGCYQVVEQSVLQGLIAEQGLESTQPEELAKAAGAGYVITGTVTRATIDKPEVGLFGVTIGAINAQVEVDVRATDIITGEVIVSKTGVGNDSDTNISVSRLPVGTLSYTNSEFGPLLADASEMAVTQVVQEIVKRF